MHHVLCINALLMLFVGLIVFFDYPSELNFDVLIPLLIIEGVLLIAYQWVCWKIKQYESPDISPLHKILTHIFERILVVIELIKGERK